MPVGAVGEDLGGDHHFALGRPADDPHSGAAIGPARRSATVDWHGVDVSSAFVSPDERDGRAAGFGLDLGLTYRSLGSPFTVAASVLNLGRMDELDQVGSSLPREIRGGASWEHSHFLLSANYRFPRFGSSGILMGAEVTPVPALAVRAGYQSGHDTRSLSYGIGLAHNNWRIDYAFVPSDLGFEDSHRLTLGIR